MELAAKEELSSSGICYLRRLWDLVNNLKQGRLEQQYKAEEAFIWATFDALGLGLEPTLKYLMTQATTFEAFENYIEANGSPSKQHLQLFNTLITRPDKSALKDSFLTQAQQKQWNRDGFVIIPKAISKADAAKTAQLIYDTIGANPGDPRSWYDNQLGRNTIMVPLFKHPQLDKNRFNPKVKAAFQSVWERKDLMASCDRVSFSPPHDSVLKFVGPHLHWDVSLKQPIPFGTQGLIYLTDTSQDQGAFQLVPGFHNRIEDWLKCLPSGQNPRTMDLNVLNPKKIAANAGDLIIWHQALPHGASANTSDKPRLVQYINYLPLDREIKEWV